MQLIKDGQPSIMLDNHKEFPEHRLKIWPASAADRIVTEYEAQRKIMTSRLRHYWHDKITDPSGLSPSQKGGKKRAWAGGKTMCKRKKPKLFRLDIIRLDKANRPDTEWLKS